MYEYQIEYIERLSEISLNVFGDLGWDIFQILPSYSTLNPKFITNFRILMKREK